MINLTLIIIALIISGACKWHIANLIARTPNITTYQVNALKSIATQSVPPSTKKR